MRHSRQHDMTRNPQNHTDGWPKVLAKYIACEVQCTDEYICICCKNFLQRKNPKMPNQACANGLHLDVIPQDLCDVFPLEFRLIS